MGLLETDPTTSMVTQIAAAERLIGTAVQMVFQDWDELSIREIASAAHGVLQNVKSTKDQLQLHDPVLRGVICLAREYVSSNTLPVEITGTCIEEIIVRVGRLGDAAKIDSLPRHKSHFWAQFNRPYHQVHANVVGVANEQTRILSAGVLYVELMKRQPVELDAYGMYLFGDHQMLSPFLFDLELMTAFAELQPVRRRELCMVLLSQAKDAQKLSTASNTRTLFGRRG